MASDEGSTALSRSWGSFAKTLYKSRQPPIVAVSVDKLEQAAREKLKDSPDAFLYVFGSAGTGATYAENRAEFQRWKIIPRVLRDVSQCNLETTLFGVKYPSPLICSPIGAQTIVHADGECGSAAGAGALGIPYVMSTASSRSIEAVAKANGSSPRWYMLYWGKEKDVTLSILSRIKKSGFSALVVTVDAMILGWRPFDLDTAYFPLTHGLGTAVGLTDPVFMAKFGLEPFPEDERLDFPYDAAKQDALIQAGDKRAIDRSRLGQEFYRQVTDTGKTWEDLAWLKQHWDGPLILKGILSPKDAELAIDYGADGIVVSTHGGRQVDGEISSLKALHRIMQSPKVRAAQASGKFTVILDSGIRTGSDILKAIALGAQAVMYGRPIMYALTLAGPAGVESQIRSILADFATTLSLSGFSNVEELRLNGAEVVERD
ncbi:oxidoreductase [Wolfiporia cocos MD-104 SS10]|uniref:Oxidoreductase n=1 Tax=Wolfiporia cocos (strain MD-104) TaxID=742152 RepID=A0A2H3JSN6_WOLCO|nr:oxidoreductase [Wolfiporia cocos MD-104 SS10]